MALSKKDFRFKLNKVKFTYIYRHGWKVRKKTKTTLLIER